MATYTPEEFKKKIERFAKNQPKFLEASLKANLEIVRTESVRNHLSGPKMQRGVGSQTSATLARRSGDLAKVGKRVKVESGKIVAQLISNMKYSRIHELGGTIHHTNLFGKGIKATIKMPARPFLSSALQAKKRIVIDNLLQAMMTGYRKS